MRNHRLSAALHHCKVRKAALDGHKLKPCVVYILECQGFYKIGHGNVQQRLSDMQTGNPFKINLVGHISTTDPIGLEAELHRRFKAFRVQGEWFKLGDLELKHLIPMLCNLKLPVMKHN